MATFNLNRADLFPTGTVVGLYPEQALRSDGGVSGSSLATATVSTAGTAAFTVADETPHVAAAQIGGVWRSCLLRASVSAAGTNWKSKVSGRRSAIGTS